MLWVCGGYFSGAPGQIRTGDLVVRNRLLYPSELRAHDGNDITGLKPLGCRPAITSSQLTC
jgi:hypothetical protein